MNICVIYLREESLYDDLIHRFKEEKICNINVSEFTSLKRESVRKKKEVPIFSTLRYMMDYQDDPGYRIEVIGEMDRLTRVQEILKDLVPSHQYVSYIIPIQNLEGELEA